MSQRATLALLTGVLCAAPHLTSPALAQTVTTYATIVPGYGVFDMAWNSAGELYVSSGANTPYVFKIGPGGSPVTQFASGLGDARGLAFDSSDNLYVADYGNAGVANSGRIWKITPAGVKTQFGPGITTPMFIGFDANGDLLVGQWGARRMSRITPAGALSLFGPASLGSPGEEVGGFVIDPPTGNLYVAVGPNILILGPTGSLLGTFASGLTTGMGLARAATGEFYLGRYSAHDVWKVTAGGAGSKFSGASIACVDGPVATASFMLPAGARVRGGTLYIGDNGCHKVRTIDLPGATPAVHSSWGRLKLLYR